jgi:EAL domain-containing protein (putative c-di-GMP-specific phosphodiesterase class I)
MDVDGRRLTVTASMGIALAEAPSVSSEDLLAQADVALYEAKETGRARHELFDPPMRERAWDRFELERDLRLAIERDELVVHYQPVLDLASGRLEEVEALVRWQHPTRGLLLPDTFVPLAARMGLIAEIDTIVLERACRQLREWHTGFPARARFGVSVNLAAGEFHEPGLAERVGAVLSAHGLRPSDLALELTETAMLHDTEATTETLAALHALGVSVLVDDFGTGFSALHYFKRLRLDGLKIDRSFVSGVGRSGKDVAIITAAIGFARALGLRVIAEGIETTAQLRSLQRLGCERGQGFLLQRPLPADRLTALLASSSDWPASLVRVVDVTPDGRPMELAASLQPSQANAPN